MANYSAISTPPISCTGSYHVPSIINYHLDKHFSNIYEHETKHCIKIWADKIIIMHGISP